MEIRRFSFLQGIKNYQKDPNVIYGFARTADLEKHLEAGEWAGPYPVSLIIGIRTRATLRTMYSGRLLAATM
jgi:hypothetical protein